MAGGSTTPTSKKPPNSDFYQQRLKAWQPILTPKWVFATFLLVGVVFIPLGFILKGASDGVVEYTAQYDGEGTPDRPFSCKLEAQGESKVCYVDIKVEEEMVAPVYVYYQLNNFYQNHRRYVKSRSDSQLLGEILPESSLGACSPIITNETSSDDTNVKVLHPCGLIANSYFNDIIAINGSSSDFALDTTDISWPSDRESKFKAVSASERADHPNHKFIQEMYPKAIDPEKGVTDEHFIVWMRTAALPNFRKLYGRIKSNIPAGTTLTFKIDSQFYVSGFQGKKSLVISTTSWLGGKNPFLGYAYIVVGAICIVLALLFCVKNHFGGRKLGDPKFMSWNPN